MSHNPISVVMMCCATAIVVGFGYGSFRAAVGRFNPTLLLTIIGVVGVFVSIRHDKFFLFVVMLTLTVMYPLSEGIKLSQKLYGHRVKIERKTESVVEDEEKKS